VTGAARASHDDLLRRQRVLLVALTVLRFRYPEGEEPEMVRLLRGWLGGWPGDRAHHDGNGPARLRPAAHALRRRGLAGDLLRGRSGALADRGSRLGLGADALAGGLAGGLGDAEAGGGGGVTARLVAVPGGGT